MKKKEKKGETTDPVLSIIFKTLESYSVEYSECVASAIELEEIRALREIVIETMSPEPPSYSTAG